MRHTVRLHGVIVGHSELEQVAPELGRASGEFRPGLGYELVQPVFRLFSQAVSRDGTRRDAALLERYYKARDALGLELQDEHEQRIQAAAIHIADYSHEGGDPAIRLDVLINDHEYWSRRHGTIENQKP